METDAEFIDILREIMISKNLTQTAFTKAIGVKQSQISEWLKGKARPGYDNLKKICQIFSISGDYLLGLSLYP